jgi:hypothetical protein
MMPATTFGGLGPDALGSGQREAALISLAMIAAERATGPG